MKLHRSLCPRLSVPNVPDSFGTYPVLFPQDPTLANILERSSLFVARSLLVYCHRMGLIEYYALIFRYGFHPGETCDNAAHNNVALPDFYESARNVPNVIVFLGNCRIFLSLPGSGPK